METITSTQNNLVKEIAKLQTSKGRKELGQFVVEGLRACTTFIKNGYTPLYLFITEKIDSPKFDETETVLVTEQVMKKMSSASAPSGILAVFEIPANPSKELISAGLVMANVSDPGNMGTLIRSAAAFGYKTVVVVEGCDPYSPKVIQASAGSLPSVNMFIWSWKELIEAKQNLVLIALDAHGNKKPAEVYGNQNLFVVGNEAHGINPAWLKDCDKKVSLPMPGKTESLNAAVAGSLILALNAYN